MSSSLSVGTISAAILYLVAGTCGAQSGSNSEGGDPAPTRVERALIGNLKSQLKYSEFRNNFELQRHTTFQLLTANDVRYHSGLFSSPSGDISSAVKERCSALGGTYATSGDSINAITVMQSRTENERWLSKSVTVSPGSKVQTFSCDKDGGVLIQAILAYKGSRTAGGNVFSADFYDLRVLEKTDDFANPDDRRRFLTNAAAIGSQTAAKEIAALESAERSARERDQQIRTQQAADERAKREAEQKVTEENRLRDLEARLPAFRASLKTGDDTNCGLVVEVKQPIAQIQMSSGLQWIKVADLLPAGEKCVRSASSESTTSDRVVMRACSVEQRDVFARGKVYTQCFAGDEKWSFVQLHARCASAADSMPSMSGLKATVTDLPQCPPSPQARCVYTDGPKSGLATSVYGASAPIVEVFEKSCELGGGSRK